MVTDGGFRERDSKFRAPFPRHGHHHPYDSRSKGKSKVTPRAISLLGDLTRVSLLIELKKETSALPDRPFQASTFWVLSAGLNRLGPHDSHLTKGPALE